MSNVLKPRKKASKFGDYTDKPKKSQFVTVRPSMMLDPS